MKLFSEKVTPTFTSSNQNILTIKGFTEIFFDVYELEINGNKYIAEKISEYKGNPVVNIPVVIDGKEFEAPFVLQTGKFDIIFNERNSTFVGNVKPEVVEVYNEVKSQEEEVEEIIFEKRESILEEIQQARQLATKFAEDIKQEKIRAADVRISKDKAAVINTANKFKSELIDEFLALTENTREELYTYTQEENKKSYDFIVETVTQLADKLTQDINQEVGIQTTNSISVFEEKIDNLAKNILTNKLLKTISQNNVENDKKINLKFETVSKTIAKVLGDYEVQLNEDVKLKLENFDSQILTLEKNSVELNNTITKNTNKALSRIGNVKTQLEEAVVNVSVTLSDELTTKIALAESKIKDYYDERITLVESSITDITAQERAHILNVIQESKQSILEEVSKIKTSVPSVIAEKTREPKGEADIQKIKTDLEKTISNRFTQELANVRRIIELSSGGGSVAVQFANGGTMNGNLTVVGTISASQYLGIPVYTDTDTLSTVTARGNTTTDSITVGGVTVLGGLSADRIYTTQLDALSANITVIDIKQYELSGFNVQGDCTVQGSVSADKFVTIGGLSSQFVKGDGSLDDNIYLTSEDLNSNIILYPTTTESDVEGYGLMVSSITDVAYDDPAVNVPTGPIDSADTYISSIISREGLIVGDLDTINMTVIGRIRKTSGGTNKNATFHFHVYKRDDFGNETEIGLSGDTLTVTSTLYEEYSASVLLPASTWEPTDKLVLKLFGILIGSGGGASPTYDFQFGGATPVRVLIPLPTSVQLSNYVPYIGASKDLYLGVHTVNTAAVYTNDIINDGAALTIGTNNGQPLNFETNNVQRMSITSAGNVGIGTSSPLTPLHIIGGTPNGTPVFTLQNTTANGELFGMYNSSNVQVFQLGTDGTGHSYLDMRNSSDTLTNRITTGNHSYLNSSSFNFGIGTTSPLNKLHVVGKDATSGSDFIALFQEPGITPEGAALIGNAADRSIMVQGAGGAFYLGRDVTNGIEFAMGTSILGEAFAGASTNHNFSLRTNNIKRLTCSTNGNVGIGTETPNERLTVAGNISAVGNTFTSKLGVSANSLPANVILGVGPNLINDANLPVQYSSTTPINYIGLNAQSPGTYGGLVGYTETEYGGGLILRTVPGNKAIRFVTDNNIQRMTLRSGSGNLGIGTTEPNERLTVVGNISATGNLSALNIYSSNELQFAPKSAQNITQRIYSDSSDQLVLGVTSAGKRVYLGSAGNKYVANDHVSLGPLVGIGTTVPTQALTVVGNISATGTANKLPNQLADSPESILTIGEYDEYEWYPQTTSTYDKAILNGRTLRYFQAALVIANKGTTQPFIHQPIGNRAGRFKMSIVTPTTFQYMSYDCTYYAYGTQYVGGSWNADIRRAPDVGRAWFQCTIIGSPSAVVDQVITGSRGAQVTIATASTPIVNSFQIKSVSNRLPSQGEVFTTDGGTFTVAAGGILGTISDAQASYTGALIPSVGIFWPTTMPDGTFYIRGHTTL